LDVTHVNEINDPNLYSARITYAHALKQCPIEIQKLSRFFNYNTKQQIYNNNYTNATPYCNKNDFIKIEIVNKYTTRITIPGGKCRPAPIRKQRSIIHVGTGQTNVFQWENWQLHGAIKIPTWYIITIQNGLIRTRKTAIHFALEQQTSYLTAIPDLMLSNTLLPNQTMMAYKKGDKYCERISSAITDMHNSQNAQQKQYENCCNYHNNTNICAKTQEPQCKFAVGFPKNSNGKTRNPSGYRRK